MVDVIMRTAVEEEERSHLIGRFDFGPARLRLRVSHFLEIYLHVTATKSNNCDWSACWLFLGSWSVNIQVDDSSHKALQTSDIKGPIFSPFSDLYFYFMSRGAALHH